MKIVIASRCAWTLYNFRSGLIKSLVKSGYEVVAVCGTGDGYEGKVNELGVSIEPVPLHGRSTSIYKDLMYLWSFYKIYKKLRPDIVHHFTIKPVIYGSIAAKLAGTPKIINTITGLGYIFTSNKNKLLRIIVENQYRFALRYSNITFFQNIYDKDYFCNRKIVRSGKVKVVPGSGVDTNQFSPYIICNANMKYDARTNIIMISRLLKDKGLYEYIDAAKIILSTRKDIKFILVGDPDYNNPTSVSHDELVKWVNEGIIEWHGKVDDVRPWLACSDIVVLPSYREGLPRSLLEACSMGKPVITTDVVGCRDVIRDGYNGILVPPRNSEILAKEILKLSQDNELRSSMGKNGIDLVKKYFTEDIVIQMTLESYGLVGDQL